MIEALSAGTRKRISRINRRATAEVRTAYEAGQISARRADQLLYLRPSKQRRELDRLLTESSDRERRYRVAAEVIERYLETRQTQPIDIQGVAQQIRAAIGVTKISIY